MGELPFRDKSLLEAFRKGFRGGRYPEGFLADYEIMECFAHSDTGETLLVKNRSTGVYHVAKCYLDAGLLSSATENELLERFSHHGLPALTGEYRNEQMLCVVREYAQGQPLDVYASDTGFTEASVVSVAMQLCDILTYLHTQSPPVIHRDIKPQNIIIDKQGRIKLIDFGISRLFNGQAMEDTVCFATKYFAAPEQYGFAQTDCKADIFSLGVLLAWMLTGRTDTKQALPLIGNRHLRKIVEHCVAFAPEKRAASAARVKAALLNADGTRHKRLLVKVSVAVACTICLVTGFVVGRFTDVRPPLFYNNTYAHFSSSLIERAVRLQLGKAEGERIRTEELEGVRELYVYAGHTAKTQPEFNELREKIDRGIIEAGDGDITNLSDIARLKNLQSLSLGHQQISDLSPIRQLSGLQSLEVFNCPISEISVIGELSGLRHFSLTQCDGVKDLSPLADCPGIRELILVDCRAEGYSSLVSLGEMDYMHMIHMDPKDYLSHLNGKTVHQLKIAASTLASFDNLKGIMGLETLELDGVQIKSLEGIEALPGLVTVGVWNMPGIDLTPLKRLRQLETVTLTEDMRGASITLSETGINVIFR